MATLLNPFLRALDANADAVSGGLLYVFEAGTTTPVTTYSDRSMTTAQAQPLVANAAGEFAGVFVPSGTYKIRVADSGAVVLYENDNVRIADRPDDPVFLENQAAIIEDTTSYAVGTVLNGDRDDSKYEVAASGATDHTDTRDDGTKLYNLTGRNAKAAGYAAALPDGSVTFLGGLAYEADSTATGTASCTNDLSVNGLRPHGPAMPDHFGEALGAANAAPAINRALVSVGEVYLNAETYRITGTVSLTGGMTIVSDGAVIEKNFNGVGITVSGGTSFNHFIGDIEVKAIGSFVADTSGASSNATAHGVAVLSSRVVLKGNLNSLFNEGSGIYIECEDGNANRSIYNSLRAQGNGVHGVHFAGTRDDSAVWDVSIFSNANRKSGVFFDTDFMGRAWTGYIYTEDNCKDGSSAGCDIGRLSASSLFIYSEEQEAGARDVVVRSACSGLDIQSARRTNDDDYSAAGNNNVWRLGPISYRPGYVSGPRAESMNAFWSPRAREGSSNEYVQAVFLGDNLVDFGKIRAEGGLVSPKVRVMSAGETGEMWVNDEDFAIIADGETWLSLTATGMQVGKGSFTDTGITDGKEIDFVTASMRSSRPSTSARDHHQFYNPNGEVGAIKTSGSATFYNTTSDRRLKMDIEAAGDSGDTIDKIEIVSFNWASSGEAQDFGVIAQDLHEVFPDAVSKPDDEDGIWSVDTSRLVPLLVKEIQGLRRRLATVEAGSQANPLQSSPESQPIKE